MENKKMDKFKKFVKENGLPILAVTSVAAITTVGLVSTCKYVKLKSLLNAGERDDYLQSTFRGLKRLQSKTDAANGYFTSITSDGIIKTADLSNYVADVAKHEGFEFDDISEILLVGTKKKLESNG